MDGEVTVSYDGTEHKIDIEDVNPEDLKDLFGIDFEVKFLLEVETEKTVLIKKKEKLKSVGFFKTRRLCSMLSLLARQFMRIILQIISTPLSRITT
jgi:hypothetical protein